MRTGPIGCGITWRDETNLRNAFGKNLGRSTTRDSLFFLREIIRSATRWTDVRSCACE